MADPETQSVPCGKDEQELVIQVLDSDLSKDRPKTIRVDLETTPAVAAEAPAVVAEAPAVEALKTDIVVEASKVAEPVKEEPKSAEPIVAVDDAALAKEAKKETKKAQKEVKKLAKKESHKAKKDKKKAEVAAKKVEEAATPAPSTPAEPIKGFEDHNMASVLEDLDKLKKEREAKPAESDAETSDDKKEIIKALDGSTASTESDDKAEIIKAIEGALTKPTSPEEKPADVKEEKLLDDYTHLLEKKIEPEPVDV